MIDANKTDEIEDRELTDMLLSALDPIDPPPARAVDLKRRIMERAAAEKSPFVTVHAVGGEWQEISSNVYVKKLMRNDKFVATLVRMGPHTSLAAHDHFGDEECICVEGEAQLGDTVVRAGDFHFAPKGVPHGVVHTPTGCLLYIRSALR